MIRRRSTTLLSTLLLVACTPTTKPDSHAEPDRSVEPAPADPAASQRCNVAVPDAAAAMELAGEAKRTAGLPDYREVEGPKALVAEGFSLSPMVPSQWPASDCAVVFYVFEARLYAAGSVLDMRNPVNARIMLQLDTGEVQVMVIEHPPTFSGVLPDGGSDAPSGDRQQWVFDAVAESTVPVRPDELRFYKHWLKMEKYAASAVFVWHRGFFDFVIEGDPVIMKQVQAESRAWTGGPP